MAVESGSEIDREQIVEDAGFIPTKKQVYESQQKVMKAWLRMEWPTHVGNSDTTEIVTGTRNYSARQYLDGSGVIHHYGTIAAIRTKNGLVIGNSEDWAQGFATVTQPWGKDRDATLPLTSVRSMGNMNERKLRSIVSIQSNPGELIRFEDGTAIYVGTDSTASRGNGRYGFILTEEEAEEIETPEDALMLLRPPEVRKAEEQGMEVVERRQGDGERQIVRQGEWFLIPRPDVNTRGLRVEKALADSKAKAPRYRNYRADPDTGSHVARDKGRYLPKKCDSCGKSRFEMDLKGAVECKECGHGFGELFVRGTFRHIRREHDMVNLKNVWHEAVTHDRDVQVLTGGRARWD